MLDANEYALNEYLRKIDAEDEYERRIDDRATEIMATPGFAFDDFDAISEAMGEASKEQADEINKAIKAGAAALGAKILQISLGYWQKCARQQAETEVGEEWDSCRCHGAGCRKCEGPE